MRQLFRDKGLQEEFNINGFVVVPMLSNEDVSRLLNLYNEHFPEIGDGFVSSSYLNSFEQKKQISDSAQEVLAPKISDWLQDHVSLGSAFLCKAPGQNSMLPMHSDWTIVDEGQFDAVNIWTPLTPVNETNGTLEILPESHRKFRVLRAPTMPFVAMGSEDLIYPHMKKMKVNPGDAVILNQAVIHCSGPNQSNEPRIAMTSGATSDKADLQFNYWHREEKTLETFAMERDFLLRFDDFFNDIGQRPKIGLSIGSKPFDYGVLSREEVLGIVNPGASEIKPESKSWWQKLWS